MKIAPVGWDAAHAAAAVEPLGEVETRLLWRIADARGARVPLAELSRDLGLPGDACLERDFPDLRGCYSPGSKPPFPVHVGGDGEGAWYWMSAVDGARFRRALERKVFPG